MSESDFLPGAEVTGAPANTVRTLADIVNRLLDRGVIVGGDIALSIAGVELAYIGLRGLLTSASTARTLGVVPPRGDEPPALPAVGVAPPPGGAPASVPPVQPTAEAGTNIAHGLGVGTTGDVRSREQGLDSEAVVEQNGLDGAMSALAHEVSRHLPRQVDISPDGVQRDLGRLVLTLVELIRRIVEHQAIRRMDDGDLDDERVERMGLALERLQATMHELRLVFGLTEEDLDIDLGPLGPLA